MAQIAPDNQAPNALLRTTGRTTGPRGPNGQRRNARIEGVVDEVLPDARCRVKLDNGHEVIAYTSGRMKKNRIRILAGDRVTVEMTPYDLTKGRINFRHKDVRPGQTEGGPPGGGSRPGGPPRRPGGR